MFVYLHSYLFSKFCRKMCIFKAWCSHGGSWKRASAFWRHLRSLLAWPKFTWAKTWNPLGPKQETGLNEVRVQSGCACVVSGSGPPATKSCWAKRPTAICGGQISLWWHTHVGPREGDLTGCVRLTGFSLNAASCFCLITVMKASGGALLFVFTHLFKNSPPPLPVLCCLLSHHYLFSSPWFLPAIHYS